MADRKVTFLIGANIENFKKGLNNAQRKLKRFGRDMQRMGSDLTQSLTLPILGAGTAAVKAAADYETLRQSLDILTGSADEGARVFKQLKEFSARTPFQLQDIAKAQQTLMGFSLTADEAFESIQMIGDIAAVTGGDMQEISVAFGQAAAEGRLMTRDIRQLINQGVPAVQLLADTMGVATSEVFDLAEQGEISFDIMRKAFREATSEGGRFADGMQKQSQTIAGLFSTLRDNVSIALGEIGQDLVEALNIKDLMRDLTDQLQRGVDWLKGLSDETKSMAAQALVLASALGPVIFVMGSLVGAISSLLSPIGLAIGAIGGLATAIYTNWKEIKTFFSSEGPEFMQPVLEALDSVKGYFKRIFGTIEDITITSLKIVAGLWDIFGDRIVELIKTTFVVAGNILGVALEAMSVMLDTFSGRWLTDWEGYLSDVEDAFEDTFGVNGFLRSAFLEFVRFMAGGWAAKLGGAIADLPLNLLKEMGLLSGNFPMVSEAISNFANPDKVREELTETANFMKALFGDTYAFIEHLTEDKAKSTFETWKKWIGKIKGLSFSLPSFDFGIGNNDKKDNPIGRASLPGKDKYVAGLSEMKAATTGFSSATEAALSGASNIWTNFKDNFKAVGREFKQFIAEQMTSAITTFAENLGTMFSGADKGWRTAFEKIIGIVLDFAKTLGSILISIGSAMAFTGILSGPGGAYIAAGGALVALATGFQKGIDKRAQNRQERSQNNVPGMAMGGIVPPGFPNDTYPAMLSSGETVIPAPKPLPSGGGGQKQIIQNVVNLDGKTIYRNQKEVDYDLER